MRLIQLLLLRRIHLLGEYAHDSTANRFNSIAIVCTSVPAANPPRSYRYFSLLLHAHSLKDAMFYCEKNTYLFIYIYFYQGMGVKRLCGYVNSFRISILFSLNRAAFFFFFSLQVLPFRYPEQEKRNTSSKLTKTEISTKCEIIGNCFPFLFFFFFFGPRREVASLTTVKLNHKRLCQTFETPY